MFDRFISNRRLLPEGQTPHQPWSEAHLAVVDGYRDLSERFAGGTFDNGLYRLHDSASAPIALDAIQEGFPAFSKRVQPFGFDWLGRHFAVDWQRLRDREPLVLMMEPGTGKALEIPATFAEFHNKVLVDMAEAALAEQFFREWSAANKGELPLPFDKCVGYILPLFLGGRDDLTNLELIDTGVYWSVSGQLRAQTAGKPAGSAIDRVKGSE
jgi:hypothetical protein